MATAEGLEGSDGLERTVSVPDTNTDSEPVKDATNSQYEQEKTVIVPASSESAKEQTHSEGFGLRALAVLGSICLAQFIIAFNNSSILMALPTIARQLQLPNSSLEWPIISFNLAFGGFLILSGRLADMVGRKRMLLGGLIWFGIWSIVIGFANGEVMLNVSRAMQGLGASVNVPASIGLLATYFKDQRRRNISLSFFGAMNPLGFICGSILGGVITQTVSWNAVFFIPAALTFVTAGTSFFSLPADIPLPEPGKGGEKANNEANGTTQQDEKGAQRPSAKLDILGAFLITAGIVLVTFALSAGTTAPSGWSTWYIIFCFVLSPVLLALFILWQFRASSPLMPLWLWKTPGFSPLIGVSALVLWAFQGFALYATLFLQNVYLYDPLTAAVHQIPMAIAGFFVAIAAGYLVSHYKNIPVLLLGGLLLMFAACSLWATAYPETSYWARAFPALILIVSGFDVVWNTLSISIVSLVPAHSRSLAGGVFNTAAQFGVAVGLAIDGVIVSSIVGKYDSAPTPDIYAEAYRAGFWTSAGVVGLTAAVVAFLVRGNVGGTAAKTEKGKEQSVSEELELKADHQRKDIEEGTLSTPNNATSE